MAYRLRLEDVVHEEVAAAAEWYQKSQPGLGPKFEKAFYRRVKALLRNPFLYQVKARGARSVKIRPFSYLAIFYVHGDHVVVAACVHERRDPDVWQSRIPDLEP